METIDQILKMKSLTEVQTARVVHHIEKLESNIQGLQAEHKSKTRLITMLLEKIEELTEDSIINKQKQQEKESTEMIIQKSKWKPDTPYKINGDFKHIPEGSDWDYNINDANTRIYFHLYCPGIYGASLYLCKFRVESEKYNIPGEVDFAENNGHVYRALPKHMDVYEEFMEHIMPEALRNIELDIITKAKNTDLKYKQFNDYPVFNSKMCTFIPDDSTWNYEIYNTRIKFTLTRHSCDDNKVQVVTKFRRGKEMIMKDEKVVYITNAFLFVGAKHHELILKEFVPSLPHELHSLSIGD